LKKLKKTALLTARQFSYTFELKNEEQTYKPSSVFRLHGMTVIHLAL